MQREREREYSPYHYLPGGGEDMSKQEEEVLSDEAQAGQPPKIERPRVSLPSLDDNHAWRGTPLANANPWERSEAINLLRESGHLATSAAFNEVYRRQNNQEPIPEFAEIAELALQIEAIAAGMFPIQRFRR